MKNNNLLLQMGELAFYKAQKLQYLQPIYILLCIPQPKLTFLVKGQHFEDKSLNQHLSETFQ